MQYIPVTSQLFPSPKVCYRAQHDPARQSPGLWAAVRKIKVSSSYIGVFQRSLHNANDGMIWVGATSDPESGHTAEQYIPLLHTHTILQVMSPLTPHVHIRSQSASFSAGGVHPTTSAGERPQPTVATVDRIPPVPVETPRRRRQPKVDRAPRADMVPPLWRTGLCMCTWGETVADSDARRS